MGEQNTCMYVFQICAEGIFVTFPWWLENVKSRSKIAFFFKWAPFWNLISKKENNYVFFWSKLSKLHKKDPILHVTTTVFLKQGETRTSHGPILHPLTSVPCKMMEAIVKMKVLSHVDSLALLSKYKYGFMKGRSCLTNLLETFEDVTSMLDEGPGVDMVYLDYSKAFDSVPHRRLLSKLQAYGLKGRVWEWIQDFLVGRTQKVTVGDANSDWTNVVSGVPQGSVLGPILFVLYINDLPENVRSNVKMFADDTKLYRHVLGEDDKQLLQEDLNALQKWSESWLLRFNASKCKRMHMGNTNDGTNYHLGMSKSPTIQKRRTLESTLLKTLKVPSSVLQLQARQWANWGSLSGLSPTLTRNALPPSTRPTFVPTWNIVSRRGVQALGMMWSHWRKYSVGRLRSSQVWGINHTMTDWRPLTCILWRQDGFEETWLKSTRSCMA